MFDSPIKMWAWLWCLGDRERAVKDASEKLQMSMRVTAKSRYNASTRLQYQEKFSFFTTTALSLGLIFIPLMQNAGVNLAFKPNVLNMMQIFLAVSVLVYSIVIATSRFEIRAAKLTDCGDRLKELIRSMDKDREAESRLSEETLGEYQRRYSNVVTDSENHIRSDYYLATLEMRNDYFITGIPRFVTFVQSYVIRFAAYIIPSSLIIFEVTFITDMIGATSSLVGYFNGIN